MKSFLSLLICLLVLQSAIPVHAGDGDKKKKKKGQVEEITHPAPPETADKPFKEISEVTKKCHKTEGFFNLYQDTTSGKTYLEISEDQIDDEFLYFKHTLNGLSEAGYIKGRYHDKRIFKVEKYFDRIEFRELNTKFYFDPENAISRASNANINEPVVMTANIEGMSTDTGEVKANRYLINADAIFLNESINQVKPSSRPGSKSFNLGKLNKSKTKYLKLRGYPENTDVVVEYAFDNPYPSVRGGEAATNSRYVSLEIQHSFIKLPDNDFKPRYEDSRVGYFAYKVTDLSSTEVTPYRDVIAKWNLVKKDPGAALSEPVEPITWWIENTTPVEIRPVIQEVAMKWNIAFEKAGFKNAVVINIQPDDAEWDAGDIRYNVIRWASSPKVPWGGYGPTLSDPRTGQIIGGDIMMEYSILSNRLDMVRAFDRAGLMMEEGETEFAFEDEHVCNAGLYAKMENMAAMYVMEATGMSEVAKSEAVMQYLSRVVLHELGHTMGLSHNFCASSTISIEDLKSKEIGATKGISSSVMDYHATNMAANEEDQGYYYITRPGVYDEWAIEYGYRTFENDEAEAAGLAKIVSRSVDPELCFGNDADDMRSIGRGIDPFINVSDLSSDPISFSIDRCDMIIKTIPNLKDRLLKEGESYQELLDGYIMMTAWYGGALKIITRFVGGVHIDRARVGQQSDAKPLEPVSYSEQKRAMNALAKYAFAPDAFSFDTDILNYLKTQRRGFDQRGTAEDPRIHSRVLNMQNQVLNHVLYSGTMTRLTNSELYGNKYSVAEMMGDLTTAIFNADLTGAVNGFRQNLQLEYVDRLGKIIGANSKADNISKSAALYQLNSIKTKMTKAKSTNESTKAHRAHVAFAVDQILDID
ncbi:MAG: DUF5117 domain-containing protein [Bacteroidetes bacterium]|nr:DUF5117 domain-containing protein [Bacteroidota bacterium]